MAYEIGVKYLWGGHEQPVPDDTLVKMWTVGGDGRWEGMTIEAHRLDWSIEKSVSDIKEFEIVRF